MAKVFVTDSGTSIQLDTGIDCASTTKHEIWVRKPSGTIAKYTASVSGTYLSYNLTTSDLDEVGIYTASAYIESPTFTTGKHGEKSDFEIYSVYTATGSDVYVTPDEFRHFLECYGITSTILSDDWIRKRLSNFVVPYIQRICRTNFTAIQTITEWYSGNGNSILILNRRPIIAITDVSLVTYNDMDTHLGIGNIEVIQSEGILKSIGVFENYPYISIFPKGINNLKITYTYGYTTPPADIKEAATYLLAEQALGFIGNRTGGGDLSMQNWSRNFGTRGKWTYVRNDLARQAMAILRPYMTGLVGA